MTTTERRHFSRVPFHTSAELTQDGMTWVCELLDISLKGVLVREPEGFAPSEDQPVEAAIALSDAAEIRMTVRVARRGGGALGLECSNIDVESIAHLRRLVELNLGDANAAERELTELLAHHSA